MVFKTKVLVRSFFPPGDYMASCSDGTSAERSCVRMVVNKGMALKFALIKVGLKYKSNSSEYHRIRRKICKEKEKKKQQTGVSQC